jgi:hypothetical protein
MVRTLEGDFFLAPPSMLSRQYIRISDETDGKQIGACTMNGPIKNAYSPSKSIAHETDIRGRISAADRVR